MRASAMLVGVLLAGGTLPGCELAVNSLQAEQRATWTRDYPAATRLHLSNSNGAITIGPSPDGAMHVTAEKRARAATDDAARAALDRIEIQSAQDDAEVRISARGSQAIFQGHTMVAFTVTVPASAQVTIDSANGRVEAERTDATFEIHTANGRIQGRDLRGAVRADATNGRIELDFAALAPGGVDVSSTNGRVSVSLPPDAAADVVVSCTNGRVDVEGLRVDGETSRRGVTGRLNGGGPRVSIQATNGRVNLTARQ